VAKRKKKKSRVLHQNNQSQKKTAALKERTREAEQRSLSDSAQATSLIEKLKAQETATLARSEEISVAVENMRTSLTKMKKFSKDLLAGLPETDTSKAIEALRSRVDELYTENKGFEARIEAAENRAKKAEAARTQQGVELLDLKNKGCLSSNLRKRLHRELPEEFFDKSSLDQIEYMLKNNQKLLTLIIGWVGKHAGLIEGIDGE